MTDPIDPHDLFARAGTLEVPRHLDVTAIRAAGQRRLVRRRMLGGAGAVGTAAAATALVIAVSGALAGGTGNGAPPVAGGGTPSIPPTPLLPSTVPTIPPTPSLPGAVPSTLSTSRSSVPPTPSHGPADNPLSRWDARWVSALHQAGVPIAETRASSEDLGRMILETHSAVLRDGAAGYVALLATTDPSAVAAARKAPCALARVPKDGTGKACHKQDGAWLTTYKASNQGPVQLARVVTGRADVVIAQSTGFPSYQPADDSPGLLPWDLRDPYEPEHPSKRRQHPALPNQPLPTADLIALAHTLAANAPTR